MKKLALAVLILLSSNAWAQWVQVGETDEGNFYIEPSTVRRDGHLRQVWELTDLKRRDEGGELSRRTRVQYDCKRGQTQVLSISTHWEPMAGGATLLSVVREGHWKEVPPDTAYAKAFKIVCAE
jgi:hypothetical protein